MWVAVEGIQLGYGKVSGLLLVQGKEQNPNRTRKDKELPIFLHCLCPRDPEVRPQFVLLTLLGSFSPGNSSRKTAGQDEGDCHNVVACPYSFAGLWWLDF